MTDLSNKTALAFMAHPDDAEILCAGTLIRLADAGWEVHIATATAGDCGSMTQAAEKIAEVRRAEASVAAWRIGGTYHCLEELDGMVVYDRPTLRKVIDLFRRAAPALVFTHAPKDYMMDHEMTSLLARAASFAYGAENISTLPRLGKSMIPWLYYCDPVGGVDPLGNPVEPTTFVDITDQLEKKSEMLADHASQREFLRERHGTDEYIEHMRRHAEMRGGQSGVKAAEGFVQHRGHAYPETDLLAELFG